MSFEIIVSNKKEVKGIKSALEQIDKFVKPIYQDGENMIIRTSICDTEDPYFINNGFKIREYSMSNDKLAINNGDNDYNRSQGGLLKFVESFLLRYQIANIEELIVTIPLRYTVYEPLLLFNNSTQRSFVHEKWEGLFKTIGKDTKDLFFREMLDEVFTNDNLTHVAINMPIIDSDILRRPFNIFPLYNDLLASSVDMTKSEIWDNPSEFDFNNTLWCHVVQNGIHQYWAPTFTMFSRGNIKEKKRILDTYKDIENNDIVDLYAGIGYFTLSYLKRKARNVFCFELNPWSVEGLKKGLKKNKVSGNCHVYCESNETCIERVVESEISDLRIRHINLGLLPTSKPGWKLALGLLAMKENNRVLVPLSTMHIHENVHIDAINDNSFVTDILKELTQIQPKFKYDMKHVEKIKTFAPSIWHVCIDVDVITSDFDVNL